MARSNRCRASAEEVVTGKRADVCFDETATAYAQTQIRTGKRHQRRGMSPSEIPDFYIFKRRLSPRPRAENVTQVTSKNVQQRNRNSAATSSFEHVKPRLAEPDPAIELTYARAQTYHSLPRDWRNHFALPRHRETWRRRYGCRLQSRRHAPWTIRSPEIPARRNRS